MYTHYKKVFILIVTILWLATPQAFASVKKQASSDVPVNVVCMQKALDAREATLAQIVDSLSVASKEALQKREAALKDAWAKPTKATRQSAREAAHTTYRKAIQDAHAVVKVNRKNAYTVFNTAVKNCTETATVKK